MIAIPNMDMPSCCGKCILQDGEMCFAIDDGGDGLSLFSLEDLRGFCIKRRDDCPLIEMDLERDIPNVWYNRQTGRYEPKGTKQEVYERLYKLKYGERRSE